MCVRESVWTGLARLTVSYVVIMSISSTMYSLPPSKITHWTVEATSAACESHFTVPVHNLSSYCLSGSKFIADC